MTTTALRIERLIIGSRTAPVVAHRLADRPVPGPLGRVAVPLVLVLRAACGSAGIVRNARAAADEDESAGERPAATAGATKDGGTP